MDRFNTDKKLRPKSLKADLGSMMFGKIPPQAKDLEEAVLGALLLDTNCLVTGMAKLFPEIFYLETHNKIFRAIQQLYDDNSPVDLLTVVEKLKKNEDLDFVGGPYAVTKLTNQVVSGANIERHILIIAQKFLSRETIRVCGEAIGAAYEDDVDVWDNVAILDKNVQIMQESVLSGATKDVGYFGQKVLEQHATTKVTGVLGTSTGIDALDKAMCGLVAPDLIIIAARPGQGKTALALSITYNTTILNKIPCAWFSLEMDGTQLVRRLVSMDTGIEHSLIRQAYTTADQDKMIGISVDKISESPLHIDDRATINVRDIRTKSALLKKRYGIKFIVVDYLQLMSGVDPKNKNREQIVSEISRSLKVVAKELEIPVIALSQLSREVEKRPDKMPQLSDLRESGGIEQDADDVLFLMRPEYYKMTEDVDIGGDNYSVRGLTIANIAKNRHGAPKYIPMRFTGATMQFLDYHDRSIREPKQDDLPF